MLGQQQLGTALGDAWSLTEGLVTQAGTPRGDMTIVSVGILKEKEGAGMEPTVLT